MSGQIQGCFTGLKAGQLEQGLAGCAFKDEAGQFQLALFEGQAQSFARIHLVVALQAQLSPADLQGQGIANIGLQAGQRQLLQLQLACGFQLRGQLQVALPAQVAGSAAAGFQREPGTLAGAGAEVLQVKGQRLPGQAGRFFQAEVLELQLALLQLNPVDTDRKQCRILRGGFFGRGRQGKPAGCIQTAPGIPFQGHPGLVQLDAGQMQGPLPQAVPFQIRI